MELWNYGCIFFIFLILIFKPNSLIKVNIKNNSFAMRKPSQSTTLNNHKKKMDSSMFILMQPVKLYTFKKYIEHIIHANIYKDLK